MPRTSAHPREEAPGSDLYTQADALLPDLQNALAALADVEARYELDRERLERWDAPAALKNRLATLLSERYRAERHRCAELLDNLQRRMAVFGEPRVLH